MDQIDELHIRMRISNLEARVALREIEIASLDRNINSPLTSARRKSVAGERKNAALVELSEIKDELEQVRRAHPKAAKH